MVALTGSTEVEVEEDLRSAAVVEEHSWDIRGRSARKGSPAFFSEQYIWGYFLHHTTPWKQVGNCPSAGLRWEEEEVMQRKELVTMEILENCYGNWSSAAHFV